MATAIASARSACDNRSVKRRDGKPTSADSHNDGVVRASFTETMQTPEEPHDKQHGKRLDRQSSPFISAAQSHTEPKGQAFPDTINKSASLLSEGIITMSKPATNIKNLQANTRRATMPRPPNPQHLQYQIPKTQIPKPFLIIRTFQDHHPRSK